MLNLKCYFTYTRVNASQNVMGLMSHDPLRLQLTTSLAREMNTVPNMRKTDRGLEVVQVPVHLPYSFDRYDLL